MAEGGNTLLFVTFHKHSAFLTNKILSMFTNIHIEGKTNSKPCCNSPTKTQSTYYLTSRNCLMYLRWLWLMK